MSLPLTLSFLTDGYGLEGDDLDLIVEMDRLKDISQRFSETIQTIQQKFHSRGRMRIIEFNETSGIDPNSNEIFNRWINMKRHVFYSHLHSNKDCCVVFFYTAKDLDEHLFRKRVLPHEFAHHFQWAEVGFPCLLHKLTEEEYFLHFGACYTIGPKTGTVYVDNVQLKDDFVNLIKDSCERISDLICERILIEKGFTNGIMKQYNKGKSHDPLKDFPNSVAARFPEIIRYMRRWALYDIAEWQAILKLAYPNYENVDMLTYDRNWIIDLNKGYDTAGEAFNQIHELSLNIDYTSLKKVKRVIDLLGIQLKTEEKW